MQEVQEFDKLWLLQNMCNILTLVAAFQTYLKSKFHCNRCRRCKNLTNYGYYKICAISLHLWQLFKHIKNLNLIVLFHVMCTLLVSQRVKIQLLPIHSKHMVLWPFGCTKLSSKILERQIIVNILKSSLQFSMEKCMVNGEDILLKQQKQHNFVHFISVLLQQLVIHSNFNQATLFRRCYCGFLNLLAWLTI